MGRVKRGKHYKSGQRKKRLYHQRRNFIIAALGGECEHCSSTHDLEFDHKGIRKWSMKLNQFQRMARYLKEFDRGKIRLLCSKCNGLDGYLRRLEKKEGTYHEKRGQ